MLENPWISLVVGAVVGAVLGSIVSHAYSSRLRRPHLVLNGSGSAGASTPGRRSRYLSVWNSPYRFSFEIGGMSIGRIAVFPAISRQLLAARDPAEDCHAWLFSADGKRGIAALQWRPLEGESHAVTLTRGKGRDLLLIASDRDRPEQFHVHRVHPVSGLDEPVDPQLTFNGPQDFRLKINYDFNQSRQWKIKVRERAHGDWDVLIAGDDLW